MSDGDRRMELIGGRAPPELEAGRLGLGLLVGLFAGRGSLVGAVTGRLAFESGLAYFVVTVLLSVGGVLVVGGLYDRFSAAKHSLAMNGETSRSERSDGAPDDGAMGNRPADDENHDAVERGQ
jgi:hypothetical protein